MKKSKILKIFVFLLLIAICDMRYLPAGRQGAICKSFAQEEKAATLTKQIIEAKTNEELYPLFERLKDLYFSRPGVKSEGGIPPLAGQDNKYNEFVDLLRPLIQKKKTLEPFINYYTALARYCQLKYLEETQGWDEYFSQGNTYRDEITSGTQKTIDATPGGDTLHLYSRFLLWQFHRDQQDVFSEQALSDLMSSVLEYSKVTKDAKPIKAVADKLFFYGERGKSKELYKVYTDRIITSDTKDEELKNIASTFYKEGNLDLAENIYDVYVGRILQSKDKEKLIPVVLIEIAKDFSYKDEGSKDAVYAEKIFKKIEELGNKETFNQELMYLRAFNLEKAKDYEKAKDIYNDLVVKFPENSHADEAIFKIGIIHTYVLRNIEAGRTYFEKLARKETPIPQAISSLYQLGLLSQWEGDFVKAKEYFNLLLAQAKDGFLDTAEQAQERLKEIEEQKPMEHNLKTFLDASLKEENTMFDMTKLDLRASIYKLDKDKEDNISANAYLPESGCMQIEVQYLWSGDMGKTKPTLNQTAFNTAYNFKGTKVINLVVVSPTGIIDRNIDLVDVY